MPSFPITVDIPENDPEYQFITIALGPLEAPPTTQNNPFQWDVPPGRVVVDVSFYANVAGNPGLFSGHFDAEYAVQTSSDNTHITHLLFERDASVTYFIGITTIAG